MFKSKPFHSNTDMARTHAEERRQLLARLLFVGAGVVTLGGCERRSTAAATIPDEQAFARLLTAPGFNIGPGAGEPAVCVVFDPLCPHCSDLWTAAQPLADRVTIRWVPIGIRAASAACAAAILGAPDPALAMKEHKRMLNEGGDGYSSAASTNAALLEKVQANTSLFKQLGSDSVPLTLYRLSTANGGGIGRHKGSMGTAEMTTLLRA